MKIVKTLTVIAASLMMLTSCFKDYTTTQSYTLVATFDYTDVKFEKDSVFYDVRYPEGYGWVDLVFKSKIDTENEKFDGGHILSSMRGRVEATEELPLSRFRAYCDKADKGNPYLVYVTNPNPDKMPDHAVVFNSAKYGTCAVAGCYITNTETVADQIKKTFEKGDVLIVKAKGYLNGEATAVAEMKLAEFTNQKDSIVSKWTPFDLQKLGNVDAIDFEVVSTKEGIDADFCLDNFIAKVDIKY